MKNFNKAKKIALENETKHKITFRFLKDTLSNLSLDIDPLKTSITNNSLSSKFVVDSIFLPFLFSIDDSKLDDVIISTTYSTSNGNIILSVHGRILCNILCEIQYFPS